jgi:hypothetical protein
MALRQHFQRALLGLNAGDAGERALGLGGGHRVVAGAHHALARGQVVLQAHQAGMALTQVAQGGRTCSRYRRA